MILSLDTTTIKVIRLRIDENGKTKRATVHAYADASLPKIAALLKNKKPSLIGVVNGPGAFTATRNGVTIANALSFAWGVPVTALTVAQFDSNEPLSRGKTKSVAVIYGAPPNITIRKKK